MPGMPGDKLPLGASQLAWSFNADGKIPQAGVNALAGAFPKRRPLPGVVEQGAGKP